MVAPVPTAMLAKVLLLLSVLFLARVEGPQAGREKEASASDADVYGPQPRFLGRKLPTEKTKALAPRRRVSSGAIASQILNTMLSKYDHKLRPGIGEKPTVVTVEVSVNSLGPLSILDMEYTIDIIFYQTWYDKRLCYNDSLDTLILKGDAVSQLWIPDTFFRNSKRTQEHTITMPNQMVRIHRDGKVLYTVRMTVDAACSLDMHKFPMDSHSCPLSFSSFSYTKDEMIYKWGNFKVEINEKNSWKLFQFEFIGVTNKTETLSTPIGDIMVMTFFFNVSRRFGYVALQNYVPSSVTTMLSWVSFWIKRESAPARTSVGVTSVITMTTLGTISRKHFPRVSYVTALDCYILICFLFCFCALMEFVVLNFLIYNRTKTHPSPILVILVFVAVVMAVPEPEPEPGPGPGPAPAHQHPEAFVCNIVSSEGSDGEERATCSGQRSPSSGSVQRPCRQSELTSYKWFQGCKKYFCMIPDCKGRTWQQGRLCIHIYRLDNYSRILFPVTFFFFNLIYWLVCFYL